MHCAEPACLSVCPTGATIRRDDGIVIVEQAKCVGCRACITACPYDARFYVESDKGYFNEYTPYEKLNNGKHPAGIVDKCDFCLRRLEKGEEPVCVGTCITKARVFGNLDDLSPSIRSRGGFQLRPELGTDPGVYYLD
jgi:molybdopterin-containing oxidoreductase family iron-sulfur binding subunit